MPDGLTLRTLDDGTTTVSAGSLAALRAALAGELLTPDSPGYDDARTVWNGMIDRRPGLIAMVTSTADVQRAMEFARQHDLLVAVFGGGHNIAGKGTCEGGLLISFARMRAVEVDPGARTASVRASWSGAALIVFEPNVVFIARASSAGPAHRRSRGGRSCPCWWSRWRGPLRRRGCARSSSSDSAGCSEGRRSR